MLTEQGGKLIMYGRFRRSGLGFRNRTKTTGALEHALSVWNRSRVATADDDIAFVGTLAEHVSTCRTCPMVWIEGDRPVDHLETAIRRSRVRDIWKAVA
jgi:hypothetical protein